MFRYANEDDVEQILPTLFQIFDEMELDIFKKVGNETMTEVIKEGFSLPNYRYGLDHILVNEIDSKVAAIAISYSEEEEEEDIDAPLLKILKKHGIKQDTLFTDKEAWPGEWYLDSLPSLLSFRTKASELPH